MEVIKVKDEKVVAKIELEDGKTYEVMSPNFEQLKSFDDMKRSEDSEALFKAFEKLGLPVEVSKRLPITVLNKISEKLLGDGSKKK